MSFPTPRIDAARTAPQAVDASGCASPCESARAVDLGLAIVRKIAQRNGGEHELEATPGGGTTFRFTMRGVS